MNITTIKINRIFSFIAKPHQILRFLFILTLSIILSERNLYVAIDDYNYVDYFSGTSVVFEKRISSLFEEPLWRAYANFLGSIIAPESAIRFTIFISVILFLDSLTSLNKKAFYFIVASFLICAHLAVQLYFNQLRQGFAISLFLFASIRLSRPLLGATIASMVHTSLLAILLALLLVTALEKGSAKRLFGIFAMMIAAFFMATQLQFSTEYLGRRGEDYALEGALNFKLYIYFLVQYIPVFALLKNIYHHAWKNSYYLQALTYMLLGLLISFFHEAGGRLLYFVPIFSITLIAANYNFSKARLAGNWLLLTFLFSSLYMTNNLQSHDSWLGRWALIFDI